MLAQHRHEGFRQYIDDITDLAMCPCLTGHRVHRVLRPARGHGQHDEAVPAIDLFRSGQSGLAPIRVRLDLATAAHHAAFQRLLHARWYTVWRQPVAHQDAPAPVANAGQRL